MTKLFLENLSIETQSRTQPYNNPTNHKHKLLNLSSNTIKQYADEIYGLLIEPLFMTNRFRSLKENITQLAQMLVKYSQFLDANNTSMKKNHDAIEPLRTPKDGSSSVFKTIQGRLLRSQIIVDKYKSLELELSSTPLYEPILVNEFAPVDRKKIHLHS